MSARKREGEMRATCLIVKDSWAVPSMESDSYYTIVSWLSADEMVEIVLQLVNYKWISNLVPESVAGLQFFIISIPNGSWWLLLTSVNSQVSWSVISRVDSGIVARISRLERKSISFTGYDYSCADAYYHSESDNRELRTSSIRHKICPSFHLSLRTRA